MRRLMTAVGAIALAAALAGPAAAAEKMKVGFVYVGPIGDFGYSYQHNQGRLAVDKALGDKVETTYLENVPEADSERAIEQLARAGNKLIFTTSFGFMEPTLKVAKKFPDVKFEHATGYKRAANVSTYSARFHEGRYVAGQILTQQKLRQVDLNGPAVAALHRKVLEKNELFFHRWRPQNSTYLFGFRKHEQGNNAVEIPQFDPLIVKAEGEIDTLKKAVGGR